MSDSFAVDSGVRQSCRIAPDLFLGPMDYVMERTVHRGMTLIPDQERVPATTLDRFCRPEGCF